MPFTFAKTGVISESMTLTRVILYRGACLPSSGFPGGSDKKESACNAGDLGSIPGSERAPGGHGSPLQYPFLENPTDRRAWWVIVHSIARSWTQLSD